MSQNDSTSQRGINKYEFPRVLKNLTVSVRFQTVSRDGSGFRRVQNGFIGF